VSAHGWVGQGYYKIPSPIERSEKKIAREKNNGSAGGWGRRAGVASRAERGELTRFFEIRSDFFKNVPIY